MTTDSADSAPSSAPESRTLKTLWALCVVLLVATVVVFGTSLWVFRMVHGTVETARTTTVPAILDVLAAREALVKADGAAIENFQSGEVRLSGPGLQHLNQLTFASQSLAKVAENNAAGQGSSQRIQLLEGLLESYSGLIGQAHAHFGTATGTADLWSASRLLHAGDTPILHELDELLQDQKNALNDQIVKSAMTIGTLVVWVVPIVVLFVLLGMTQVLLKRRFRRVINPLLLLATVVLVGLSIVTSLAVVSQHQLEASQHTLDRVVREWTETISAIDVQRQRALLRLVTSECNQEKGGCGPTINALATDFESTDNTADGASEERVDAWVSAVDEQTSPAASNSRLWFLIPLTSALIAVLISFGLWPRLAEYRHQEK